MVCLQENTLAFFHWYMVYLTSGHQNLDMFVLDVRQVLDFAKEKFGDIAIVKQITNTKSHHSFSFNNTI